MLGAVCWSGMLRRFGEDGLPIRRFKWRFGPWGWPFVSKCAFASLFLLQQLLNAAFPPAATLPGGVLHLVATIAVLLALLDSITELTVQSLGAIQKAAPKQFLRRGLGFFFYFLGYRRLFFCFWDN